MFEGEQRDLNVNKGKLLLLCYVQEKTTVSSIERWARYKKYADSKILNPIWLSYKNLKLEGRTKTLHVC